MTKQAPTPSKAELTADERRHMVARLHRSYVNLVAEMAALQAAWDGAPEAAFLRAANEGWQLGAHWRDPAAAVFDAPFWTGLAPLEPPVHGAPGAGQRAGERLVGLRDAVLAFPSLIVAGDKAAIKRHIDVVLRDYDADLADEILKHEDFDVILDVIRHDESVLSFMAYVGLMITSVPPNFYAFVAGKGAPCLMLEMVLLAVATLLSGGYATTLRIGQVKERFLDLEPEATAASEALNVEEAAYALLRMVDDLRRATDDVHQLCVDIEPARRAGAGSGTSLADAMAAIVADTSCRDCGSKSHTTTRSRMGTISYE